MNEPIRILCVDDERNVLRAIERTFLDHDYEIHTAMSGEEGIEILARVHPVQIVISDYRMPGTNGVDFLKAVCERWPDTVRIVLSGYADMAAVVSAINEGQIYKFIPKPWNDDELKITIANAVERYELQKRNTLLAAELRRKNEELEQINENLERLVEERTSELRFQNRVLTHSQNILDCLPVGVLGLEADGMIVQCNQEGRRLLAGVNGAVIGMDAEALLPDALKSLVRDAKERGSASAQVVLDGHGAVRATAVFMHHPDGQEGVVLVLDRRDDDAGRHLVARG